MAKYLRYASLLLGLARGVLVTDPVPLTEYYSRTLKDYEGLTWQNITPATAAPMLRVRNLADAEFKDLVRRGYPFIVDDCASEAELKNVPCSEYGRRWPKEHMRAEYTPGQAHINLEDPTWYSKQKPTATALKHLSRGKPLSGPYIWHVKDETEDAETKPTIMNMFPVPYFLNNSVLNSNEARDSFEFWFVLEYGGSQAHADAYCETTISLQLRGKKTWRLGAFPNITNAFQPFTFHDAEIYRRDEFWRPEHEEVVDAGQCVVFPMGYIHETYVPDGAGGDDACSVATTFQFQDPQPVHQWKNFLTRWGLSHYARDEPCLDRMMPYVYLGHEQSLQKAKQEMLKDAFSKLDGNQDGWLTYDELHSHFSRRQVRLPWTHSRGRDVLSEAAVEKAKWMAQDALLFHDDNQDSKVSMEEFEASVAKFQAVMRRLKTIKKTRDPKKLLAHERKWIREHLCVDEECSLLKQLEIDFDAFGRRKARTSEL